MKQLSFLLGVLLFSAANAWAETEDVVVEAEVCEKIEPQESKSSARGRASDKASFKAIEDIPLLSPYRTKMDSHNFNLRVYRLIDNYLEDLKISVTDQDEKEVCVHVSAYLPREAVQKVFDEAVEQDTTEAMSLEVEDSIIDDAAISIPPRPQIVINKDIAYPDEVEEIIAARPEIVVEEKEEFIEGKQEDIEEDQVIQVYDTRTKVFLDQTTFYNGDKTSGFFEPIKQLILSQKKVQVFAENNNPDYIIKPQILKAKVDNVNEKTSRLQMVVAVDLIDTSSSEMITEHQNRFVLFNQDENAQKKASDLAQELIGEAVQKLLPNIKVAENVIEDDSSIITPN